MLAKMRWMVEQFCYVTPLTALLGAALDREQNYQKHLHAAQGAVQVMRLASMFICLQALFALYMLSHHALQKYKTTAKFLSIKALILLSVLQKALVMLALHAGVIGLHPSRLFTEADAALRLQAFLLLAEVPFLQVLVNRAFPAEELSASDLLEPLA
ncbi:unnamed protein product [Effrenium voratum]|nr:unnamed protein product [Effrenium voratum]